MRLIDADAINFRLDKYATPYLTVCDIENAPTIDPVHAAGGCYCRECAMFKNYTKVNLDFGICKRHNSEVDKDAFCSYGVRKDGEKHD